MEVIFLFLLNFRDLGERLRKVITEEFPQGPISKVDDRKLNADLDAYTRLTNNIYFNKYPRKYPNSSVTELDIEKLRVATSTEGMNILSGSVATEEESKNLQKKIFSKKKVG